MGRLPQSMDTGCLTRSSEWVVRKSAQGGCPLPDIQTVGNGPVPGSFPGRGRPRGRPPPVSLFSAAHAGAWFSGSAHIHEAGGLAALAAARAVLLLRTTLGLGAVCGFNRAILAAWRLALFHAWAGRRAGFAPLFHLGTRARFTAIFHGGTGTGAGFAPIFHLGTRARFTVIFHAGTGTGAGLSRRRVAGEALAVVVHGRGGIGRRGKGRYQKDYEQFLEHGFSS